MSNSNSKCDRPVRSKGAAIRYRYKLFGNHSLGGYSVPAVVEVKISGESGFVLPEDEYADELTLTDHHIAYKCRRYEPLDLDPVQSWTYTTNSAAFKNLFSLVVRSVFESFERAIPGGDDMPVTRFRVTFQNKKPLRERTQPTAMSFPPAFLL